MTLLVAVSITTVSTPSNTFAQAGDIEGLVDAFAPDPLEDRAALDSAQVDSAAPAHLVKAERAVSQQSSGNRPPTLSFPSPAEIREVVDAESAPPQPTVRRIKSAEDDSAFLDGADMQAPPAKKAVIPEKRPVIQPAKVASTPPKAPKQKDNDAAEKLAQSEARIRELERELGASRSHLAAAELEISRLSTIIESHSRARLNLPVNQAAVRNPAPREAVTIKSIQKQAPQASIAEPQRASVAADLQVGTITVEKADLRLGPGRNHSALMSLRKGSRLAIETRQGEWYRVFAPNGQRAWIHSSSVSFGDGALGANDGSAVRIKGLDAKLR